MTETVSVAKKKRGIPLQAALLLGILWLAALLWMTLTTSNPITLNRVQIRNSDFVARGKFDDQLKRFHVVETWPATELKESLGLRNTSKLHVQKEKEYLIPVISRDNSHWATPSPMKDIPLIYPANADSLAQLQKILNGIAAPSPKLLTLPD